MTITSDADGQDPLAHVLVSVATEEDTPRTVHSLDTYGLEGGPVSSVVEKPTGTADETLIARSARAAVRSFAVIRRAFPAADDRRSCAREVVGDIVEAVDEVDATAIAYRSREGGRIGQFLAGDRSLELITGANHPMIVLPEEESDT